MRAIRPTRSGWCRISRRCCTTTRSCWNCWRWRTRIGPIRCMPQRAAETVGWMMRDMTAERVDGRAAFAASEDADSEGEEGRFYVWTEAEVDALLGADAPAFKRAYDVTPDGNWEGHTILRRVTPAGSAEEEAALARARDVLFAGAREAHAAGPRRQGAGRLERPGDRRAGARRRACSASRSGWRAPSEAFDFILAQMGAPDGRVQHAWRLGRVTAAGLLDDQAAMARAALALFEATGDARRLAQATAWCTPPRRFFADGHGGFYTTAADATDVPLARPRTAADNATPAGERRDGGGLRALVPPDRRCGVARTRRGAAARLHRPTRTSSPACPALLSAADLLEEAATVVIAGDPADRARAGAAGAALCARRPRGGGAARSRRRCAARRSSGVRQGPRRRRARGLCLPAQRVRPAGHRRGFVTLTIGRPRLTAALLSCPPLLSLRVDRRPAADPRLDETGRIGQSLPLPRVRGGDLVFGFSRAHRSRDDRRNVAHVARKHALPRHPRASGDPCNIDPRLRGDDEDPTPCQFSSRAGRHANSQ